MLPEIVARMPWTEQEWSIDHQAKKITPRPRSQIGNEGISPEEQNGVLERLMVRARNQNSFEALRGWKDELSVIYGSPTGKIRVQRVASVLLGIVNFGVHLTACVNGEAGMKIWVARRSASKLTYPNMLDNSVAGGMSFGEQPLETIIREAIEEVCLPEEFVRHKTRACGVLSFYHHEAPTEGEPSGLLQPLAPYVFDLELPTDIILEPDDGEVGGFSLFTVDEVKEALKAGKFRPGSMMVLLDFLIRHSFITPENEPDYFEIVSRLHRRLPFLLPTS